MQDRGGFGTILLLPDAQLLTSLTLGLCGSGLAIQHLARGGHHFVKRISCKLHHSSFSIASLPSHNDRRGRQEPVECPGSSHIPPHQVLIRLWHTPRRAWIGHCLKAYMQKTRMICTIGPPRIPTRCCGSCRMPAVISEVTRSATVVSCVSLRQILIPVRCRQPYGIRNTEKSE